MRKMKDSGIQWIGQIPENWQPRRLKSCISARDSGAWGDEPIINSTNNVICLRIADFDYSKLRFKDIKEDKLTIRNYNEKVINNLLLKKYDILIEKSGGGEKTPVGRAVMFDKNYNALYANFMDRIRCSNDISPRFFIFLLFTFYKNDYTRNYINQTTGIQNLDLTTMLCKEIIALPPLAEQTRIANFLDQKCSAIDSVLEKTKASIEEYKKLKQSVITQAVTKGIRPNRQMKDSGIEWVGKIPEDWEAIPIKYLASYNDDVLSETTDPDYEFEYIEIGSVEYGKGITQTEKLKFEKAPSRARRVVKKDDVIISTVRTYLRAIATIGDSSIQQVVSTGFIVIRAKNILPSFLKHAVLSEPFICKVESHSNGISYPAINSSEIVKFKVPLPPLPEQQAIADYLDTKCTEIDNLIAKKEQFLKEIETYKKSLIYEYVTGKKEVI